MIDYIDYFKSIYLLRIFALINMSLVFTSILISVATGITLFIIISISATAFIFYNKNEDSLKIFLFLFLIIYTSLFFIILSKVVFILFLITSISFAILNEWVFRFCYKRDTGSDFFETSYVTSWDITSYISIFITTILSFIVSTISNQNLFNELSSYKIIIFSDLSEQIFNNRPLLDLAKNNFKEGILSATTLLSSYIKYSSYVLVPYSFIKIFIDYIKNL